MSEIRRYLEFVCKSIEDFKEQSKSTDKRIAELRTISRPKDERISRLEEEVNELKHIPKRRT